MFDEGPAMKLGTGHLPPAYPLNQIQTPLILFEGTADSLYDASLKKLPSLAGRHDIDGYEHLDFMWAESVSEKVWPLIIKYLNRVKVNTRENSRNNPPNPISPPPEISKEALIEAFKEFLCTREAIK